MGNNRLDKAKTAVKCRVLRVELAEVVVLAEQRVKFLRPCKVNYLHEVIAFDE
ncbi:hypothetical protein [Desulfosporosinus acididurans]|uniref:hypothetical protein n=1 Tax=Desulfosporosinus acididurans TaxID=476652 RepID=UPI000ABDC62D|nr:hypothetical protein [Desulfosporosinus acididurans]